MANIFCSDSQHASRSAQPGWRDVVATGSVAISGLVCDACAKGSVTDATVDTSQAVVSMYRGSGDVVFNAPRTYPGGAIASWASKATNIGTALTPAERTTLATLIAKLFAAAV